MTGEQLKPRADEPDFGMDFMFEDFDINAAFQEAVAGVASDEELQLEEKVRRMEVIVSEGTSEIYREFVDFRQMAAQMEMLCTHDHAFSQLAQGSDTLSGFMDSHGPEDGHGHQEQDHKHEEEYEIDPKTGKKTKKKKRRSWFGVYR